MVAPQSPHRRNPEGRYWDEKDRPQSPRRAPLMKLDSTAANLSCTWIHTSSGTILNSGAPRIFHSSRGRSRLSCRPVRGSRTLRVRFQMAGPKMGRPSMANGRTVPQACKEGEITVQLYKYPTADGRKAADLSPCKRVRYRTQTVHL